MEGIPAEQAWGTAPQPLGTLGPMQSMISDFSFPALLLAVHPLPSTASTFFPHFLACCNLSAVFLPSHSWFCQDSSLAASFCSFFICVGTPVFYFFLTKHVSMSPEKQKRNKEMYVTRGTKTTPTVAQVSGLVHIIICLLSPLIFPSCHLCLMVKTNF